MPEVWTATDVVPERVIQIAKKQTWTLDESAEFLNAARLFFRDCYDKPDIVMLRFLLTRTAVDDIRFAGQQLEGVECGARLTWLAKELASALGVLGEEQG